MKLISKCVHCIMEGYNRDDVINISQFREDNIYLWTCPNGHELKECLLNEKFELLFDFGILALLDGYPREAISSFAVARERFHEFCIEVFLVDRNILPNDLENTWKAVASQSERQLGAFYYLYLNKFQRVPPWREFDKYSKLRNKAVHQGYFPSIEEANNYAQHVYDYVWRIIEELRVECGELMIQVMNRHQKQLREKADGGPIAWRYIQTSITANYMLTQQPRMTFDEALNHILSNFNTGWVYGR